MNDKITISITVDPDDVRYVLDGAELGADVAGRSRPGLNAAIRRIRKAFAKAGIQAE